MIVRLVSGLTHGTIRSIKTRFRFASVYDLSSPHMLICWSIMQKVRYYELINS